MKAIRYQFLSAEINRGTEEEPHIEKVMIGKTIPYSEENMAIAQREAYNGEITVDEVGESLTPAEQREEAYNTSRIIPWDGGNITVTEAAQLWQYYAAEGNIKAYDLQALISKAKAEIRGQYPEVSV